MTGTVTTTLTDIPWDEAFDLIATSNGLGYVQRGSVVRVAPLAVLAEEEAQRRKVDDERALSGELRTVTKLLSYAEAKDVQILVRTRPVAARPGAGRRAHQHDHHHRPGRPVRSAMDLVDTLDVPQPQVEIEARIVQTSREFARQVGVNWGVNGRMSPDLGNTTGLTFPNQGSVLGPPRHPGARQRRHGRQSGRDEPDDGDRSRPRQTSTARSTSTSRSRLLERTGKGRILSTPRVSTQNNIEAEIMQGVQIPIQTVANNTVTVTWKDAALILRVQPQITNANTVIMRIVVENGSPDFSRAIQGNPPINTQRANTQVRVVNGDTTVIGGIFLSTEQATQSRTPGLGNAAVPWLAVQARTS